MFDSRIGFGTTLAKREKKISRPEETISWYFAKKIDLLRFFCSAHSSVSGHHRGVHQSRQAANSDCTKFSLTSVLHFYSFLKIPFLCDFLFTANNYFLSWRLRIVPKLEKQSRFSKRSSQGSLCHRNAPSTRKGSFIEVIFSETPVLTRTLSRSHTLQWWREGGCSRRSYQTRSWWENLVFCYLFTYSMCKR